MTRDPFALGVIDPLIALGAEKSALDARLDAIGTLGLSGAEDSAISDPLVEQLVEIEDRIAAAVPISPAGAVVQLTRLREYAQDFQWCEHHDQFVDNLIAGLERLGERGNA
jgi:hypothetical protein